MPHVDPAMPTGKIQKALASATRADQTEKHLGLKPIRFPSGGEGAPTDADREKKLSIASSVESTSSEKRLIKKSKWTIHHVFGVVVFSSYIGSMLFLIPIVVREKAFYKREVEKSGEPFGHYLSYRFMDWFTSRTYAPPLVLLFVTATLIVTGAVIYSILVGGSPSHALWRIFVWSTGSPAEGEVTGGGRFLGTIVTVCGLIILSLLLGIVTETFASKMSEIKSGMTRVVEGGHVLILGYSDCTRCLIEELSNARESDGGGVFVILAKEEKEIIERRVAGDNLQLRNSSVVVRSGVQSSIRDLMKVSAGSAGQIVIMADSTLSPEEADAKSIRTLLSLKTKGWPTGGRIVVQCCSEANTHLFRDIYDSEKVEVVIVGNIVAELMARSSEQHGLATVFGMMLGFEGDEFYSEEWDELVGKTFKEAVFRFPDAVAIGVMSADDVCRLNPGWDYQIAEGDKIIVLAEDNDTYEPHKEIWYECEHAQALPKSVDSAMKRMSRHSPRVGDAKKFLVIGWNPKVCALLDALEDMVSEGSKITFYSPCEIEERNSEIQKFEMTKKRKFTKFEMEQIEVEESKFTSRLELMPLEHWKYDSIFVMADAHCKNSASDERSMAVLAQLTHMHPNEEDVEDEKPKPFDPVVEMCEDSTFEHLKICGFSNFVHSNSLVSQALAAVTEDPSVNAIYADLMSGETNTFEFVSYDKFLPPFEAPPEQICFWEIAYMASLAGDVSVVGWTKLDENGERSFEINPKDKTTPRKWFPDDRVVIIRRFSDTFTPRPSLK